MPAKVSDQKSPEIRQIVQISRDGKKIAYSYTFCKEGEPAVIQRVNQTKMVKFARFAANLYNYGRKYIKKRHRRI
jgi:hypothetical protein